MSRSPQPRILGEAAARPPRRRRPEPRAPAAPERLPLHGLSGMSCYCPLDGTGALTLFLRRTGRAGGREVLAAAPAPLEDAALRAALSAAGAIEDVEYVTVGASSGRGGGGGDASEGGGGGGLHAALVRFAEERSSRRLFPALRAARERAARGRGRGRGDMAEEDDSGGGSAAEEGEGAARGGGTGSAFVDRACVCACVCALGGVRRGMHMVPLTPVDDRRAPARAPGPARACGRAARGRGRRRRGCGRGGDSGARLARMGGDGAGVVGAAREFTMRGNRRTSLLPRLPRSPRATGLWWCRSARRRAAAAAEEAEVSPPRRRRRGWGPASCPTSTAFRRGSTSGIVSAAAGLLLDCCCCRCWCCCCFCCCARLHPFNQRPARILRVAGRLHAGATLTRGARAFCARCCERGWRAPLRCARARRVRRRPQFLRAVPRRGAAGAPGARLTRHFVVRRGRSHARADERSLFAPRARGRAQSLCLCARRSRGTRRASRRSRRPTRLCLREARAREQYV